MINLFAYIFLLISMRHLHWLELKYSHKLECSELARHVHKRLQVQCTPQDVVELPYGRAACGIRNLEHLVCLRGITGKEGRECCLGAERLWRYVQERIVWYTRRIIDEITYGCSSFTAMASAAGV